MQPVGSLSCRDAAKTAKDRACWRDATKLWSSWCRQGKQQRMTQGWKEGKGSLGPVFTPVCQPLVEKIIGLLSFASDFGPAAGVCSCAPSGPSSHALGSLAESCWMCPSLFQTLAVLSPFPWWCWCCNTLPIDGIYVLDEARGFAWQVEHTQRLHTRCTNAVR